jgi:hypothetical protein
MSASDWESFKEAMAVMAVIYLVGAICLYL